MKCVDEIVKRLRSLADPANVAGMARFGINPDGTLGVSIPILRKMAREIGRDHRLAGQLWKSGIHEARILASMTDEPGRVTRKQMDAWVKGFDSWDVCDQVCMNLFDKTPFAWEKAAEWAAREAEFEKRAGFALIACLARHDKEASDARFKTFLPVIERGSDDPRNFVKKAVSWALRHIGKRSERLSKLAIAAAKRVGKRHSKAAGWVSRDVLRELTSEKVGKRLAN